MTERLWLKLDWSIMPRDGGYWITERTRGTGDAVTGEIEFGPFDSRQKAQDYAAFRQRGLAEMMERMRAQMTLKMRQDAGIAA